jgi:hypothetical protein
MLDTMNSLTLDISKNVSWFLNFLLISNSDLDFASIRGFFWKSLFLLFFSILFSCIACEYSK